ncbi:pyrimidine/purine nucleoside phosphorylase [Lentisphaerota bacterium WC36G]|nr:pyrimidine/purine nucleoside phosphorylase [Lentisphaerae bacterium WC36]
MKFDNVSVEAKANTYFDGKVVSYAITLENGEKKTLGVIFPGEYKFNTAAAERMEITMGKCTACVEGETNFYEYEAGSYFDIPANSFFKIKVDEHAEYVCSYINK